MISDLGGDIAIGVAVNDDDSDADEDVETRDAWGEMEDMPDDREEGISEAVRLARMRTRLAACEALAVTMTDPAVHARVTVGVVILRKLKDVNLTMPYALPDPTTLATLEVVYETLNSIIDDDRRPLVLAAARGPLTAALGEQPSALTLTAVVVRDAAEPDADVHAHRPRRSSQGEGCERERSCRDQGRRCGARGDGRAARGGAVREHVRDGTGGGHRRKRHVRQAHMRPVMNFATRRHAASLYQVDKAYLDAIDFADLLADAGALPYVPDGEERPRYP